MANNKPLTKAQIVSHLSEKNTLTKKQVSEFFDILSTLAYKETKKSGKFTLPGFGILKLRNRKARIGRNPATGEQIKIAAKTVVKFVVTKACKEAIVPPKK